MVCELLIKENNDVYHKINQTKKKELQTTSNGMNLPKAKKQSTDEIILQIKNAKKNGKII